LWSDYSAILLSSSSIFLIRSSPSSWIAAELGSLQLEIGSPRSLFPGVHRLHGALQQLPIAAHQKKQKTKEDRPASRDSADLPPSASLPRAFPRSARCRAALARRGPAHLPAASLAWEEPSCQRTAFARPRSARRLAPPRPTPDIVCPQARCLRLLFVSQFSAATGRVTHSAWCKG
jgi:hypothetical protein